MALLNKEEKAALKAERSEKNRLANLERQARGEYGKAGANQALSPRDTAKGQKQRMAEFKEMLLREDRGTALVRKMLEVAMNDEHPGQMQAIKMCVDRVLPVSLFEEKKVGGERPTISINISGIGEATTGNVIDG